MSVTGLGRSLRVFPLIIALVVPLLVGAEEGPSGPRFTPPALPKWDPPPLPTIPSIPQPDRRSANDDLFLVPDEPAAAPAEPAAPAKPTEPVAGGSVARETGANSKPGPEPDLTESTPEFFVKPKPESMYGRWMTADERLEFYLVEADESGNGGQRVEAHSERYLWKGWEERGGDKPQVFSLFLLPRAEEMNPDLPAWVRQRLDGELEWRLDLIPVGNLDMPQLQARWYRGEIRWDEDGEDPASVKVLGPGTPLEFTLQRAPILQFAMDEATRILIEDSALGDEKSEPLAALFLDKTFFASVWLPGAEAEKAGKSITLTLTGKTGGSVATIELDAATPGINGAPVRYTHAQALSLGDCGDFKGRPRYRPPLRYLDWLYERDAPAAAPSRVSGAVPLESVGRPPVQATGWTGEILSAPRYVLSGTRIVLGLEGEGNCIDFDAENGEIIEASYGESTFQLAWYRSWVQAAIAQQREEMERYRDRFNAIVTGDGPTQARDAARQKLQMVRNYDALMRADFLLDLHRLAIGEAYLGGDGGPSVYFQPRDWTEPLPSPTSGLLHYTPDDFQKIAQGAVGRLFVGTTSYWAEAMRDVLADQDIGLRAAQRAMETPNVVWTSDYSNLGRERAPPGVFATEADREYFRSTSIEKQVIYGAVRNASRGALNFVADHFFREGTLALYDTTVNAINAAVDAATGNIFESLSISPQDALILLTGSDHFGRKIDRFEYWMTALGTGSLLSLEGVKVWNQIGPRRFGGVSPELPRRAYRDVVRAPEVTVESRASARSRLLKGRALPDRTPKSLTTSQRARIAEAFERPQLTPVALDNAPARRWPVAVRSAPLPPSAQRVLDLEANLLQDYGDDLIRPRDAGLPDALKAPLKSKTNDAIGAANYAIWRQNGGVIDEGRGLQEMHALLDDDVRAGLFTADDAVAFGRSERFDRASLNGYMQQRGLRVSVLDLKRSAHVGAAEVGVAVDGGWSVLAEVDLGGERRFVTIDKVTRGADGIPVRVTLYDPKYGVQVEIEAPHFNRLLAREDLDHGNLVAVRATDPERVLVPPARRLPPPPPPLPPPPQLSAAPTANAPFHFVPFEQGTKEGQIMALDLGEQLGKGASNSAFAVKGQPNLVARISNKPIVDLDIQQTDAIGRAALERVDQSKVRAPRQHGNWLTTQGFAVELVEKAPETWAEQNRRNGGGGFTRGQALAVEAAARELNQNGFAWFDNHSRNFSLEPLPGGGDRWRVVIFDTGGILPVIGDSLQARYDNARRVQRLVNLPEDFLVEIVTANPDPSLFIKAHTQDVIERSRSLFDYSQGFSEDALALLPTLGLQEPRLRELAALGDAEFVGAYAQVYGTPGVQ